VNAAYTAEYTWDITKTVDGPVDLFDGQTGSLNWQIAVEKSLLENRDHKISGVINVANNSVGAVQIASIIDTVQGNAIAISCEDYSQPLRVGASVAFTYTNVPVASSAAIYNVVVTLANATTVNGSAPINWASATVTRVNDTASVADDQSAG